MSINLRQLYIRAGNLEKTEKMYMGVIQEYKEILDRDRSWALDMGSSLALLYIQQNEVEEAQ